MNLIVKDNALINASYTLDLVEQRLILLAILEARQSNVATNNELTVYAENYINHFGVHKNSAYEALKNACDNLFERRFSYQKLTAKGNIEQVRSRWVQRISYVNNEALVRLKFSDDVIPLITQLEKHFTSYELEQISGLTSAYAVRLYELLIAWRSAGKTPIFGLNDFRNKLGILENEYSKMINFKTRVLNHSISQINTHTDIIVTYEQHKSGRTITGFSFAFKAKKAKNENKPKPKGETINGVLKADIERLARAGETYEQAAERIKKQGLV